MASPRIVSTRAGAVECPAWCIDDHSDVDLASSALWHASAPVGPEAQLEPSYVDGTVTVRLRQFVVLDGEALSTDPVTVNFGVDGDFDEGGGHLAGDQARRLASALIGAADLAVTP